MEQSVIRPYYEKGGIVIYHGDCRDVLPLVNADVVVTDPPYGIGWTRGVNPSRNSKPHDGIQNDEDTSVRDEVLRILSGKPMAVFGSFYAPFPEHVKHILVWHKPSDAGVVGSTLGFRRDVEPIFLIGPWPQRSVQWPSVLRSVRESIAHIAAQTGHPHTKPFDIISRLIDIAPNGTILDPFMGSGTTLVAAKNLGRKAIGIEIEERYCEIAAQRLSQEVFDFEVAA
jgi:DNA modification methylase